MGKLCDATCLVPLHMVDFFFQGTSSVFKHEKRFVKDAKNHLWPTLFYILWVSLVLVWPSTYALTYGINKYYKCSQFMPSCEAHTMGCELLWDKTTGIIFIGNQNHHHLANCWQFSTLNEFWLGSVLFSWRQGHVSKHIAFWFGLQQLKAL